MTWMYVRSRIMEGGRRVGAPAAARQIKSTIYHRTLITTPSAAHDTTHTPKAILTT